MDAFEVLVLVLGITLAVFLVLGIVAAIYIVKILRHVQAISQKAEKAVDYAQVAAKTLASTVSPAVIAQMLIKQVKKSLRNKK